MMLVYLRGVLRVKYALALCVFVAFASALPTARVAGFVGSAGPVYELEVKPVALVYSPGDFEREPWETHYAFMTAQYNLILAGIPYDVVTEDELVESGSLDAYSCLIFPYHRWVGRKFSEWILKILPDWVGEGGSIICMGIPAEIGEAGIPVFMDIWLDFYREVFRAELGGSRELPNCSIIVAAEHPITRDYPVGYEVPIPSRYYDYLNASFYGRTETLLRTNLGDVVAVASEYRRGRGVLFSLSGYNEYFQRTKILLRAIQWAVYGSHIPVGIGITSGRLSWILNIDADWTADTENTRWALRWLLEVSERRCFPFSWALITGTYSDYENPIDWKALKPTLEAAEEAGVEIASHTVHHPIWTQIDSEGARREIIQSRRDIEGNLTEVWSLQVPDGRLPLEYYPHVREAGYRYFIQTFAAPYLHMLGIQPLPDGSEVMVLWRSTCSDFYYFDFAGCSPADALSMEVRNFDEFYDLGHSAPYILLWHDYSLVNETRREVFLKVLEYEYWNRTDVFPLTPKEFFCRFRAWRKLRFTVSYLEDGLVVQLDARGLNKEDVPYTSAMCIRVDGDEKLGRVYLSGELYPLFSDDQVILPELKRGVYEFRLVYGEAGTPQITHITSCRIHSARVDGSRILLNVSRLGDNRVRIFLKGEGVVVNGVPAKFKMEGGGLSACVTIERVELPPLEVRLPSYFTIYLFLGLALTAAFSVFVLLRLLKSYYGGS